MTLTVNGENKELEGPLSVTDLLGRMEVKMIDMVSVELNDEIIRREAYDTQEVKDGDRVEFLYFMGGGAA